VTTPADAPDSTTATPEELSSRVAKGLKWSLVSTVLGRVFTPITSIILAHLLVPEDFGVFSVAVVVQSALMSFNDLGVTNAIVWWRGDVREAARTATSLAVVTSSSLYAMCFLVSPFIASAMGSTSATGILRLLSLTVVIDGVSSVPIGILNREFRQDRRAFADWFGFVLSTGLTIGLAVAGFGAWSLAWGRLAGTLVTTASLFLLAREKPRPGWDTDVARKLLGYGIPLAGSSILVFLFLNLDYIIVGHALGATALGIYTIAFNLASWPSNVLSATFRRVAIPVFAHLRHDPSVLRTAYLAGLRNLMLITLPLSAGLCVLAVPLIALLYPTDYAEAASVLTWLAVLGVARVYLDFAYDLLSGVGRTLALFLLQAGWVVVLLPALLIGTDRGGVQGAAIAHVIVAFGVMVPAYTIVVARNGPTTRVVLLQLARPVGVTILGGVLGLAVTRAVSAPVGAIFAGGTVLVMIYALLAASRSELRSLPKRLLRFEPAEA
jgi:O-antigen/teichoic acid export membrane protein